MDVYEILVILLILCLLLAVAIFFCFHYGLLTEVRVKTSKSSFGKLTIAYKFSCGSYTTASRFFLDTCSLFPDFPRIGIFYGNKKEPLSPECFAIGSVINQEGTPPDEKMKAYLDSYGYRYFTFPEIHYAVTGSFPFRNSLSLVFAVSILYPKIAAYILARKLCAHPVIEIYGPSEILIFVPLSRQNEFYVPEAEDLYSGTNENGYLEPVLNGSPRLKPIQSHGCGNGHLPTSSPMQRKPMNSGSI